VPALDRRPAAVTQVFVGRAVSQPEERDDDPEDAEREGRPKHGSEGRRR